MLTGIDGAKNYSAIDDKSRLRGGSVNEKDVAHKLR